jgi:hypothetical protein
MRKKHGAVGAVCEVPFKSTRYSAPSQKNERFQYGAVGAV